MAKGSKKDSQRESRRENQREVVRDDVHVHRNFIEQTMLDFKHFVQNNKTLVVRSALVFVLLIIFSLMGWAGATYADRKANALLYQGQKLSQEIEQKNTLLSLLEKSPQIGQGQSKDKKSNDLKSQVSGELAKQSKKAEEIFQDLLNSWMYMFSPAQEIAKYELGKLYLLTDKNKQAVTYLQMFVDDNSGHFFQSHSYLLLGRAWEKQKKYQQAYDVYKKLWQVNAKSYAIPETLYNMGRMQEKMGQLKEAQKTYERVIRQYKNKSYFFTDKARKRLYLMGLMGKK